MSKEFIEKMTAEEAVIVMTLPVFYILSGQATPTFPRTTSAAPSKTVQIIAGGTVTDGTLPLDMEGKQFDLAVKPVLRDPLLSWDLPINRLSIPAYQQRVSDAILKSFKKAGY